MPAGIGPLAQSLEWVIMRTEQPPKFRTTSETEGDVGPVKTRLINFGYVYPESQSKRKTLVEPRLAGPAKDICNIQSMLALSPLLARKCRIASYFISCAYVVTEFQNLALFVIKI